MRDKLVLIKVASHAYGDRTSAFPSQAETATSLGCRRETAKSAYESLTALQVLVPHGEGRKGKQETFTIDLDRATNLTIQSASNMTSDSSGNLTTQSAAPDDSVGIKHKHREDEEKNKGLESVVASNPKDAVVPFRAPVHGNNAMHSQDEEPDDSVGRFTKREINDQLLTPNGKLPDADGIDGDLSAVLTEAESPTFFNSSELDKLVAAHGEEHCAFQVSWLLRRIAHEYKAGRPVTSPAGLYRRAVEGGWQVDPAWPEFDELKHTDAAWKIKNGIAGNGPATHDELDDLVPF
jgi:hypothetical protein